MTNPPLAKGVWLETKRAIEKALAAGHPLSAGRGKMNACSVAADALGIAPSSVNNRMRSAKRLSYPPVDERKYSPPQIDPQIAPRTATVGDDQLIASLRKKPQTLGDLARRFEVSRGAILDRLDALKAGGTNVHIEGEMAFIEARPAGHHLDEDRFVYVSRPDNTFVFGACGDKHFGSKYERLDCLSDFYDRCAQAGVDRVFDTGNWIDGEARFNRTDIHTHGMETQLRYLARHHPRIEGITTFAVSGDDHEGWYAQREGIDIGRRAEQTFMDEGRDDWVDLGYQRAHVRLVNANTGVESILAVVHPGGGSAYADSYSVQKIIEALDGGEKPNVALYGHYHKLMAGEYRNVWWVQTGCFKDRDSFAEKMKLRFSVGGAIVRLEQCPKTGSIVGFAPQLIRYFARHYHNNAFSKSGRPRLPDRAA